jgi:hypothetical protein
VEEQGDAQDVGLKQVPPLRAAKTSGPPVGMTPENGKRHGGGCDYEQDAIFQAARVVNANVMSECGHSDPYFLKRRGKTPGSGCPA